jgi:hypothetical protein
MYLAKRSCPLAALLTALVLLYSCGPKVTQLKADPSFNYGNLTTGRIGIGGVTSLVETYEVPTIMREELSRLLQLCIMDKREDLEVQPAGTISLAMGEVRYHDILDRYSKAKELRPKVLSEIDSLTQDAVRYLVFARIEEDVIERDRSGEHEENYTEVTCTTTRSVMVSFKIYDLQKRSCAWSGLVSGDISNENIFLIEKEGVEEEYIEEKEEEEEGLSLWGCCIAGFIVFLDILSSGEEDDSEEPLEYPEPPALQNVLKKVFWGFAETLPRES